MLSPIVMPFDAGQSPRDRPRHGFRFLALQAAKTLYNFVMRVGVSLPSSLTMPTSAPRFSVALKTRPMPMRPGFAIVQIHHLNLQHPFGIARRRRNVFHDRLKERSKSLELPSGEFIA